MPWMGPDRRLQARYAQRMTASSDLLILQTKVRWLTWLCLLIWLALTLSPVWVAWQPRIVVGGWPLDFWLAAQGALIGYVLLVAGYAWQVNRWERLAGISALHTLALLNTDSDRL